MANMRLLPCLLLFGSMVAWSQALPSADQNACKICQLELRVGMKRSEVEQMVSALLKRSNAYSQHGNSLPGGTVEYQDGGWALRVSYKAGAPAPWVAGSGSTKHLAPMDETVLSYEVVRRPANTP
jgi:hypothetical protein